MNTLRRTRHTHTQYTRIVLIQRERSGTNVVNRAARRPVAATNRAEQTTSNIHSAPVLACCSHIYIRTRTCMWFFFVFIFFLQLSSCVFYYIYIYLPFRICEQPRYWLHQTRQGIGRTTFLNKLNDYHRKLSYNKQNQAPICDDMTTKHTHKHT